MSYQVDLRTIKLLFIKNMNYLFSYGGPSMLKISFDDAMLFFLDYWVRRKSSVFKDSRKARERPP